MPHSSDETKARSPFSAQTIERSLSLSFKAIMPPVKPKIMEKGPFMSRDGKAFLKNISCLRSSSLFYSMVDQKEAEITLAISGRVSFFTLIR